MLSEKLLLRTSNALKKNVEEDSVNDIYPLILESGLYKELCHTPSLKLMAMEIHRLMPENFQKIPSAFVEELFLDKLNGKQHRLVHFDSQYYLMAEK
jgi:hypothetical protein